MDKIWFRNPSKSEVIDSGLNPGPPALVASTLPLGYRGGGP